LFAVEHLVPSVISPSDQTLQLLPPCSSEEEDTIVSALCYSFLTSITEPTTNLFLLFLLQPQSTSHPLKIHLFAKTNHRTESGYKCRN